MDKPKRVWDLDSILQHCLQFMEDIKLQRNNVDSSLVDNKELANKYLKILEYIRILQDNGRLFESPEVYLLDKKLEETFKLGKVYQIKNKIYSVPFNI